MVLIKAYFLLCHTILFRAFWLEHRTLRYCGIHFVTLLEKSNTFYICRTALPDGVFRRNRACTEYAFILLNYLPCKSRADIGVSSYKRYFPFCRKFAQISIFYYSRVLYPFFPESRTKRQILPNICVVDDKDDKNDKSDSYIFIVLIVPSVLAI